MTFGWIVSTCLKRNGSQAPTPSGSGLRFPGGLGDESDHMRAHMLWSTGVKVPRNVEWDAGEIAVVGPTSPYAWRKLAYTCALLPKRENGYDFASFAVGDGHRTGLDVRAYLYRVGDRVVGFAAVYD